MSPEAIPPRLRLGPALSAATGRPQSWDRLIALLFLVALLHAVVILGVSFGPELFSADGGAGLQVLRITTAVPEASRNDTAAYLAERTQVGSGHRAQRTELPDLRPAPAAQAGHDGADSTGVQAQAPGTDDGEVLQSSISRATVRYLPTQSEDASQASDVQRDLGDSRGDSTELVLRGDWRAELRNTPDTRASALAPYLAEWKEKVERVGTLNYPSALHHGGPPRNPIVEVTLGADGRLLNTRITRSSGEGAVDQAALNTLRLASPFTHFPAALARHYQSLRFAYEWQWSGRAP